MRLIDADALKKKKVRCTERHEWVVPVSEIDWMPTIEERKKGRWERHYSRPNVYADLYWHCSECGYKNDDNYAHVYHHFCPNCGAAMRMEKK